ncbi:hypothetical protein BH09PSE5_BH09PSE5_45380 [soil metagenome]
MSKSVSARSAVRVTATARTAAKAEPTDKAHVQAVANFDLLAQLPHLLRRAHFEAEAKFSSIFGDEFTSRQLALLVSISSSPGVSQAEIAQQIGLDPNTCSDLVARTLAKKLIRRERSEVDGRVYRLFLTTAGIGVVRAAVPRTDEYRDAVARNLKPAETEKLVKLLRKLMDF